MSDNLDEDLLPVFLSFKEEENQSQAGQTE